MSTYRENFNTWYKLSRNSDRDDGTTPKQFGKTCRRKKYK